MANEEDARVPARATTLRSRDAELTALSGLRGFAALWVIVYHVWVEATPRLITLGPLDLTPLFSAGWAGVDIFFTLSAFLLSLPYASRQLAGAPRPSLRTYWDGACSASCRPITRSLRC